MAGKPGRSGRRPRFIRTSPDWEIPEIGEDEDSIRKFLVAVALGVARSMLDPRTADTMIAAAKAALAAIKQKDSKSEIERLQKMLDEARKVAAEGRRREAADRTHSAGEESE